MSDIKQEVLKEKTAEFISSFRHYDLEVSGKKSYTIRDLTPRVRKKLEGATHVRIRRGYTKRSFTRKIANILEWKDNLIISWNEEDLTLAHVGDVLKNEYDKGTISGGVLLELKKALSIK